MSAREWPDWMYSVPDARTAHIRELEAALLESNNTAALHAAMYKILAHAIKMLLANKAAE